MGNGEGGKGDEGGSHGFVWQTMSAWQTMAAWTKGGEEEGSAGLVWRSRVLAR